MEDRYPQPGAPAPFPQLGEQAALVAGLDPLGADGFFAGALPQINAAADVRELVRACAALVPPPQVCGALDQPAALAATRDLGIIAASLATHTGGIDAAPGLAEALLALAQVTGEVPRDTLYTYTARNPADQRMRMFLGIPEERLFIRSVADSMSGLLQCIQAVQAALDSEELDARVADTLGQAATQLRELVDSMLAVRRGITPEVFSFQLRPFFPLFEVGGRVYAAPSGPQLPLLLLDLLLAGAEDAGAGVAPEYSQYIDDNLPYLPPALIALGRQALGRPSLVGRLCAEVPVLLALHPARRAGLRAVVGATLLMLAALLKFRWPHKRVADDNMRLRPPEAQGSSGYTADVLEVLLQRTQLAHARVKALRDLTERPAG